jgi:hypothetical protein
LPKGPIQMTPIYDFSASARCDLMIYT